LGAIRKQSILTSIILLAGVGLGYFLKLFVFTKYLTADEIGLLTVLLDAANLLAALIPLGTQQIYIRYMPAFKSHAGGREGLFIVGLLFTALGFGLFVLLYALFRESLLAVIARNAHLLAAYLPYFIPLLLARLLYRLGMVFSRAMKQLVFSTFLKEVLARLLVIIAVLLYSRRYFDFDDLVFWYVTLYGIIGALMMAYVVRQFAFRQKPSFAEAAPKKLRAMATFGLFAVLTSVGTLVVKNIDSLMITSLKDLSSAGIYSIAFFIGMIIELPRRALSQSVNPYIAQYFQNDDMANIALMYRKTSLNQLAVGLFLVVVVWLCLEDLFTLIPNGEVFRAGKWVVLFIALANLVDMATGINTNIIQNSPKYPLNLYLMLSMSALFVLSNLVLIPRMGITGAALATFLTFTLVNGLRMYLVWVYFKIQPFTAATFWVLLIGLAVYGLVLVLPGTGNPWLNTALRSLLVSIGFWGALLYFNLSEDFSSLYGKVVSRLKK